MLGDTPDPRWSADIDQVAVVGHRWLTEIAYFHRPSRTAILGDIGFHVDERSPPTLRAAARLLGVYGRVAMPLEYRYTIANEAAFRRSIRDVLAWEFDRVVPGHGTIVDSGGKRAVLEGFEWLF